MRKIKELQRKVKQTAAMNKEHLAESDTL